MAEIPLASEFKLVVYKQVDAGFYSTFSYVSSVILMHMPLAILECFIFGTFLYWMGNFADEPGRYFFYLLILLGSNLSIGAMFRTVAYVAKNPDVALNLAGPVTSICLLFGGQNEKAVHAGECVQFLRWPLTPSFLCCCVKVFSSRRIRFRIG
jgi:ABC-type multidrug transport system permease subunit